jgi:hypothetical protein
MQRHNATRLHAVDMTDYTLSEDESDDDTIELNMRPEFNPEDTRVSAIMNQLTEMNGDDHCILPIYKTAYKWNQYTQRVYCNNYGEWRHQWDIMNAFVTPRLRADLEQHTAATYVDVHEFFERANGMDAQLHRIPHPCCDTALLLHFSPPCTPRPIQAEPDDTGLCETASISCYHKRDVRHTRYVHGATINEPFENMNVRMFRDVVYRLFAAESVLAWHVLDFLPADECITLFGSFNIYGERQRSFNLLPSGVQVKEHIYFNIVKTVVNDTQTAPLNKNAYYIHDYIPHTYILPTAFTDYQRAVYMRARYELRHFIINHLKYRRALREAAVGLECAIKKAVTIANTPPVMCLVDSTNYAYKRDYAHQNNGIRQSPSRSTNAFPSNYTMTDADMVHRVADHEIKHQLYCRAWIALYEYYFRPTLSVYKAADQLGNLTLTSYIHSNINPRSYRVHKKWFFDLLATNLIYTTLKPTVPYRTIQCNTRCYPPLLAEADYAGHYVNKELDELLNQRTLAISNRPSYKYTTRDNY